VLLVGQPYGEIVDRVAILDLKCARIEDPARRAGAVALRAELVGRWSASGLPPMEGLPEWAELVQVNGALWEVEDALREHERRQDFGPAFVELARSVYRTNDRRAALKASIDRRLASPLWEPKSHA
jgi:hypothetical protein